MGTQGIVSVVQGGKTLYKVIAGSNGDKAGMLAMLLSGTLLEHLNLQAVYQAAQNVGFGTQNCLVAMNHERIVYHGCDEIDDSHPNYRITFDDPQFNPRWGKGTADYVEIVEK